MDDKKIQDITGRVTSLALAGASVGTGALVHYQTENLSLTFGVAAVGFVSAATVMVLSFYAGKAQQRIDEKQAADKTATPPAPAPFN